MLNSQRKLRFWISTWLPVAIGIGVIAVESTQYFGADRTSGPLRAVFETLFGQVNNTRWDVIHHYIRKSGHFVGYGLIGLAWLRAWWKTLPQWNYWAASGLGLLGTLAIASSDEWHQSYLPNRTASPWDVLIDCSGALTMQVLVYLFLRMVKPERLAERR
jgi:VanZ family protein